MKRALALLLACPFLALPADAADPGAATEPSSARVISHADVRRSLAGLAAGATIIDLRRKSDYDADTVTMPGAQRLDPDAIAEWSKGLPKDKEIVLFCAHGRSISNASVDFLTKAGFKARLVPGGFDAWKGAGGTTVPKSQP